MKFIEKTHQYIDEEGRAYIPVTTFLKSYQEYVDWDAVAAKKAKKDGVSKESLLDAWAQKRDKAANRGTTYHKVKELELLASGTNVIGYHVDEHSGTKDDSSMILSDNTTYVEKMIWNKRFGVCGTADLVEVSGGKITIKDYKTNEKLDFEAWSHPRYGPKKLLSPITHLDDCNFNLYQLQINCYMHMLLQQNRQLKMGDMEILHVIFDENNVYKETKVIPVSNMQAEVRGMFMTKPKS